MRLALHTDFALRCLLYLGERPGRATVAEVAQFFQISAHHLAKVVQELTRLGFVRSVRGSGGGFELAQAPENIRLGQVISACEGGLHLLDCVRIDEVCVIQQHCRLRIVLTAAEQLQQQFFDRIRLSDLLRGAGPVPVASLRFVSSRQPRARRSATGAAVKIAPTERVSAKRSRARPALGPRS